MKLLKIHGKKVVDAKRGVTLHILPEDVKRGRRKAPDCCAAAQACMRQMNAPQALVHLSRVYVETPKNWVRYTTPPSLRTEIVSFDRGHVFEAGDYRLGACTPTMQGDRRNPKTTRKGRNPGTHPKRGNRKQYISVKGVRVSAGANPTTYAAAA